MSAHKYNIREICGDWALDIHWGNKTITLFFNSRNNAELVKAILEWEDNHPNAAVPYKPTLTQPNEPLTVTEVCPHCESEITMEWDVKTLGYKAYCPVCGNRLMLCDECQHGEPGHICDYDSNKDTCRFNRHPPEGKT